MGNLGLAGVLDERVRAVVGNDGLGYVALLKTARKHLYELKGGDPFPSGLKR